MGNLFFVFTPLQLFVAQQIVRQERLTDTVLVQSVLDDNTHFMKVFDMMRIDSLWNKVLNFTDFAIWNGSRVRSLSTIKNTYRNFKRIKQILKENNIGTIYLGEILNQACRFTDVVFHHQGYKIAFFEEGTSHYVNRPYVEDKSLSHIIKIRLLDAFYFKPFYGVRFAEWNSNPNRPYDDLPIDKRFSIIPFHHKPYDVLLKIKPMLTEKLRQYILSNVSSEEGEHRMMLLTDPLRELLPQEYLYLYFDTIKECIAQMAADVVLYVKFHPRELQTSRNKILEIVKASRVRFAVLSDEVNICVEYYLQMFHFEKIFFFNAATYFYNGYAFPKMEFVKLMPELYRKSKEAGVENLTYMENLLEGMDKL